MIILALAVLDVALLGLLARELATVYEVNPWTR